LAKIGGLGLVTLATSLIRYFNYCFIKQLCKKWRNEELMKVNYHIAN